jgi:hypothetical protein
VIKLISAAAVVVGLVLYSVLQWQARHNVVTAGFWFEDVTFDLPHLSAAGFGGPLTDVEKETIEAVAWSELRAAFAGLRITFTDDDHAMYQVRVVQDFGTGRGTGAAGASRVLPPLGGNGSVNFLMLGSQAVSHAPAGADRQTVVDGIGRGIGRSAVHEFLHLILPRVQIHDSKDMESYEFGYSSRPAQYYGRMRWDIARPALVERLGYVQEHQDAR